MALFRLKVVFPRGINLLIISILIINFSCKKDKSETLPFYNTENFTAEWIKENDAKYSKIHTIDSFSLRNQEGKLITKDSLDEHIYVANFFFSICPSICPQMMTNLSFLQKDFANNPQVKLASFTVMPWVDSVGKLKKYGEDHKIDPSQWYLLTGSKEAIYTLARKSFFAEKRIRLEKTSNQFLHTEAMFLIDKKGRIRGVYKATQIADIESVTEDINTLLNEQK